MYTYSLIFQELANLFHRYGCCSYSSYMKCPFIFKVYHNYTNHITFVIPWGFRLEIKLKGPQYPLLVVKEDLIGADLWMRPQKLRPHVIAGVARYNLTKLKVRPLFMLSHRGSDNSPLLIVFSANYIDQSIVTFMPLKVRLTTFLIFKNTALGLKYAICLVEIMTLYAKTKFIQSSLEHDQ